MDLQLTGALSIKQVTQLTRLSRATIYREMDKGAFPKKFNISTHRVVWDAQEVYKWVEDKKKQSNPIKF